MDDGLLIPEKDENGKFLPVKIRIDYRKSPIDTPRRSYLRFGQMDKHNCLHGIGRKVEMVGPGLYDIQEGQFFEDDFQGFGRELNAVHQSVGNWEKYGEREGDYWCIDSKEEQEVY